MDPDEDVRRLHHRQLGRYGHRGKVDRPDKDIGEGFTERSEEVVYVPDLTRARPGSQGDLDNLGDTDFAP